MMRFLKLDSITGQLHVDKMGIPEIQPDEVLVKVQAFGVNRADLLQKEGKYPPPQGGSGVLGMEVSGIVEKLGEKVDAELIGKPVCAMIAGGGYAEFVPVKVEHLIPVLGKMDVIHCAGFPEVFLTAYQSLFEIAHLKPEQNVLIHAGASGVGTAAIQLAKHRGCQVAVTTSSEIKNNACKQLGADICINYKTSDFASVLKEYRFAPNVIVDVVGEGNLQGNLNVAAMDCVIVQLAMLGGRYVKQLDLAKLLGKRIQWQGSTLRNRRDDYKSRLVKSLLSDFSEGIQNAELIPVVDTLYKADEIELAHEKMSQNQNVGKLIARW